MPDDTSPATKADIKGLMDSIGKLYDASAGWKDDILQASERWKDEILDEMKRHFDVAVEDIRHDLEGANRDEIDVLKDTKRDHEKRITKLEHHVGVVD
jgi:predicted phage gp36 major capsid-like protein